MSQAAVVQVISKALGDAVFRRLLLSDPKKALEGYDLSAEDLGALEEGLRNAQVEGAGDLDLRISRARLPLNIPIEAMDTFLPQPAQVENPHLSESVPPLDTQQAMPTGSASPGSGGISSSPVPQPVPQPQSGSQVASLPIPIPEPEFEPPVVRIPSPVPPLAVEPEVASLPIPIPEPLSDSPVVAMPESMPQPEDGSVVAGLPIPIPDPPELEVAEVVADIPGPLPQPPELEVTEVVAVSLTPENDQPRAVVELPAREEPVIHVEVVEVRSEEPPVETPPDESSDDGEITPINLP